jgi:hypothetical protein
MHGPDAFITWADFTKREIRQMSFSFSLSFPGKLFTADFYSLSSIPPKAMKSNSESPAENQFLIKKKQSVENRDVLLHLGEILAAAGP